jgi:alcohol dehydrogenase YqhD (iron-dependent ADH family)
MQFTETRDWGCGYTSTFPASIFTRSLSLTSAATPLFLAKNRSEVGIMFYLPTRIFFAEGAMGQARDYINVLGKSCLIVTGKHSAISSGAADDLFRILGAASKRYMLFDEIPENPDLDTIMRGKERLLSSGYDYVVGIGGGSPLDAAKAIMLAAAMICSGISFTTLL